MPQSLRAWSSSLQSVITKKCLQCASRVAEFRDNPGGKLGPQKSIGGALQIGAVAVPPWFFAARQPVHINVFRLHHFKQAGLAVRAAPAAGAAAAMWRFRNCEVTDRIIHHDSARAQALGNRFTALCITGPDAGRQRKGRLVRARDGAFGVTHTLQGKYRAEGLFLKEPHRGIHTSDDRGFKKIWAEVGTGMAAAKNPCSARNRIAD